MRLHVVYRTHPGQNRKDRPAWFDRRTAWESLRASAARVPGARVTVVADGGLPAELAGALGPAGEQVTVRGGHASSSFRRALSVAFHRAAREPADTLFWFAEDDYLYRPEALPDLLAAAAAVPGADYLAVQTPDDAAWHAGHPSQPDRRPPSLPGGPVQVAGHRWDRVGATTSTFGVRSTALLRDRWLLDLGSRVGAPFDTATWHALQGFRPFPWGQLLADLEPAPTVRGTVKVVAKPLMRAVLDTAVAVARPQRALIAPAHPLAVHAEAGRVPDEAAWAELARGLRP